MQVSGRLSLGTGSEYIPWMGLSGTRGFRDLGDVFELLML